MPTSRRSARQAHWQSHLDQAQAQGISIRAYARREGLSEYSLYRARQQRRVRPDPAPDLLSAQPPFAAVRVAAVACELSLPGGIVLRLPDPPPAQWLAALAREFGA